MKQYIFPSVVLVVGLTLIIWGCTKIHKQKTESIPEPFVNGQLLYPDYACPDTLIVRDGEGLTKALLSGAGGTDAECDSIAHVYCDYYEGSPEHQFKMIKQQYPQWDSLTIVQAIEQD